MNVLSLFDGMSCGRVALERANIPVTKYYASEIDKYAIQVSHANWPDIIQLGDVTKVGTFDIFDSIDLLIGGSPCQGFSFAGKQLNFDDPRSKLFFEFVRIRNEIKPTWFFLENVVMKKEYQAVISKHLGVEPILINSALVSAQNRRRLYWTNIPFYSQPKDRGILLKDIVETGETTFEYLSEKANYRNNTNKRSRSIYDTDCKTPTLLSNQYKQSTDSIYVPITSHILGGAIRGRPLNENGIRKDYSDIKHIQRLEVRSDGKSNCLSTVQKDNVLVLGNTDYRKFTPIECERLQGLPDNYTNHVSKTQRLKMLGNGWQVDTVAHLLEPILWDDIL